jgi:predicted aspartyl protease
MPVGHVAADGRPLISIDVAGHAFEAVVDTGYEGGLQLPDHWLPVLSPPPLRQVTFVFADGHTDTQSTYRVRVTLDGDSFDVETYFAAGDEVLIGTDILHHYRLTIDFPAGSVLLERP